MWSIDDRNKSNTYFRYFTVVRVASNPRHVPRKEDVSIIPRIERFPLEVKIYKKRKKEEKKEEGKRKKRKKKKKEKFALPVSSIRFVERGVLFTISSSGATGAKESSLKALETLPPFGEEQRPPK